MSYVEVTNDMDRGLFLNPPALSSSVVFIFSFASVFFSRLLSFCSLPKSLWRESASERTGIAAGAHRMGSLAGECALVIRRLKILGKSCKAECAPFSFFAVFLRSIKGGYGFEQRNLDH
jgi:hypothetical protein